MTAADRPSVTDAARTEAERHYPALNADDAALTYPRSAIREHARGGFVVGYEAGWAAARAETTTATVEDAIRQEVEYRLRTTAAYFRMKGNQGEDPDPHFLKMEIAAASARLFGLLATARTHPTDTAKETP